MYVANRQILKAPRLCLVLPKSLSYALHGDSIFNLIFASFELEDTRFRLLPQGAFRNFKNIQISVVHSV